MKKLLKLMLQNNMLRAPEGDPANGEDGANGGGGADKGNDLSAEIAALKEQIAALQGKAGKADDPSLLKAAQDEARKNAERAEERARMANAIKFNLGIEQFVESKKDYLTKLSGEIVKTVSGKQFSDEEVKARALQAALLEDFFAQQENLDSAPAELKERILAFKSLTSDEKEKQASKYWDTLTLTLGRKELVAKAEAAKRANAGRYEETNDLIKNYNAQVFAKASKYTGEKEQAK